jgi:hypothetical protein
LEEIGVRKREKIKGLKKWITIETREMVTDRRKGKIKE